MLNEPRKILIAEDEKIIALDIQRTLQRLGYEVTSVVDSGLDVITHVEKEKPDLVLLDIMLNSKLDGIDAANIISTKYNIPIIYLTALKDESTVQRAKQTNYYEYLTKPFDEKKLHNVISQALQRPSQFQQP